MASKVVPGSLLLAVTVVACLDDPGPTELSGPFTGIAGAYRLGDVPAVAMDLPPEPRAWDTDPSALERVISEGGGFATVAFKAPAATRAAAEAQGGLGVRAAVSAEDIEAGLGLLFELGAEVLRYYDLIGAARVRLGPGLATELGGHPLVDYVEPAGTTWTKTYGGPPAAAAAAAAPQEESSEELPAAVESIGVDHVWATYGITGNGIGEPGEQIQVGIIDNGFYRDHEDLPYLAASNCLPSTFTGCRNGFHGSLVGGVLAATDNSDGIVGVAPGLGANNAWSCDGVDEVWCINTLTPLVDIISMSWGSNLYRQDIANAVSQAYSANTLLVGIANNRLKYATPPSTQWPAGHSQVIGVSGVMPDLSFAGNGSNNTCTNAQGWGNASNHGSYVELAAVFMTKSTNHQGGYQVVCGTSFAAPAVAGIAALLWQHLGGPGSASNVTVRNRLKNTACDQGASGNDEFFGYGIVDAMAAMQNSSSNSSWCPQPPPPLGVILQGPDEAPEHAYEMCHWNAIATNAQGPVTYQWKYDWAVVGSDNTWGGDTGTEGTHYLHVQVWDNQATASTGKIVEVDASLWECWE